MKLRNSILTASALLALAAPAANAVIPSDASSRTGYAARESTLERVSQKTNNRYASSRASGYAARESTLESEKTNNSYASSRASGYAARESTLGRVSSLHRSVNHFPYGYVPGGSSAKVAQAITDAAERTAR